MSKEEMLKRALEHETRPNFLRWDSNAFWEALRSEYFDEVTAHMVDDPWPKTAQEQYDEANNL